MDLSAVQPSACFQLYPKVNGTAEKKAMGFEIVTKDADEEYRPLTYPSSRAAASLKLKLRYLLVFQ